MSIDVDETTYLFFALCLITFICTGLAISTYKPADKNVDCETNLMIRVAYISAGATIFLGFVLHIF